jgi:hypothetical protein
MLVKVLLQPATGWNVELNPGEQPFMFPTKAQAIQFAIAWGEQHEPCEVRIYGSLGDLERTIGFPNGGHRHRSGPDRRRRQVQISFPDRRRQDRRLPFALPQPA